MSVVVAVDPAAPDAEIVARAAGKIRAGLTVAVPTDTVYALVADPFDPGATDRLFAMKRRSRDRDLSVLVGNLDQALSLVTAVPEAGVRLMRRCWPGELTLVLPRDPDVPVELGTDEATIGLRMPAHPVALALCREAGPLAATPAGVQGEHVHETAAEVAAQYGGRVSLVLDAGQCSGAAATVVDATGEEPRLIREGALAWADVLVALET